LLPAHSKISTDTLTEAVAAILTHSTEKKRGFVETIELQIALKNYDPNKDKRFSGTVRLPSAPKLRFNVAVIGDAKHIEDAKRLGIQAYSQDDLKKLKKDKKLVKKLANAHDAFLASATLIRMIPRLLGPGLNKAGKFPSALGANEDIGEKVAAQQASVKFQLKSKKALNLGVAVANVGMSREEIVANITLAINFFVSLLSKNWQQVKRVYIKSTMGPSHRIYGF
jgi:large subunit ribosomal protein L10Ae